MTHQPHPPNFRDAAPRTLRQGFLFRSASPHLIADDELEGFRAAGITTFIDLRSEDEQTVFGDGPLADLGVRSVRTPLIDVLPTDDVNVTNLANGLTIDFGTLYIEQLQQAGDRVAAAVHAIARAPGPCLVTCAAGRDRTGMVIAIALLTADADPDDVVADYVATEAETPRLMQRMMAGRVPEHFRSVMPPSTGQGAGLRCDPDHMRAVVRWLGERGGAAEFLTDHGATAATLHRLRDRLAAVEV